MYTLRKFKKLDGVNRTQIYLGKEYTVTGDPRAEMKYTIYSPELTSSDGVVIYKDEYAFIMSSNGETFEVLNYPRVNEVVEQ